MNRQNKCSEQKNAMNRIELWWVHSAQQTSIYLGKYAVGPLCKKQWGFPFVLLAREHGFVTMESVVSDLYYPEGTCTSVHPRLGFQDMKSQAAFSSSGHSSYSELVLKGPSPKVAFVIAIFIALSSTGKVPFQ